MTSLLNGFTSIDYVALIILILAIITFLLDLNKGNGYKYKNSLEELGISRSRDLSFTFRQRMVGYTVALVIIFLIKHSLGGMVIVLILSIVSEFRVRSILRKESNKTSN